MVEALLFALTSTPSIAPSSADDTCPVSATAGAPVGAGAGSAPQTTRTSNQSIGDRMKPSSVGSTLVFPRDVLVGVVRQQRRGADADQGADEDEPRDGVAGRVPAEQPRRDERRRSAGDH